jgi:hypothetical protein
MIAFYIYKEQRIENREQGTGNKKQESYLIRVLRIPETIAITTEAIIALPNEFISNPGTILDAIIRRIALITNVKRPRVRIVAGSVSKVSMGLRIILSIPKTTARIIALRKLSILNPGTIYAVTIKTKVRTKSSAISFIRVMYIFNVL